MKFKYINFIMGIFLDQFQNYEERKREKRVASIIYSHLKFQC